ncbi:MAG: outer membrane protein-like protein [Chlorobi bacterium]|nr:outer membrane protein-like protein [Chlorobiota bacterium]
MGLTFSRMLKVGIVLCACATFGACKKSPDTQATITTDSAVTTPGTATGTPTADSAMAHHDTAMASGAGMDTSKAATAMPMNDANILAALSMADSAEITEGKLALKKGKNADVKKFAQMMITDHGKMMSDGKALAARLKITPTPAADDNMKGETEMMVQELTSAADGADFDAKYIAEAVGDHQKDLTMLNAMQAKAQAPELKDAIGKAIPIVQKHLDRAKEIQGKLGSMAGK